MAFPDYKDQIQITAEEAIRYYNRSGYSGCSIIDILKKDAMNEEERKKELARLEEDFLIGMMISDQPFDMWSRLDQRNQSEELDAKQRYLFHHSMTIAQAYEPKYKIEFFLNGKHRAYLEFSDNPSTELVMEQAEKRGIKYDSFAMVDSDQAINKSLKLKNNAPKLIIGDLDFRDAPGFFDITAFVVIKRDQKWYKVKIFQKIDHKVVDTDADRNKAIKGLMINFMLECNNISKHHIPLKDALDAEGRSFSDVEFKW